jgi:DNA-3-methyladenine glycosylase
MPALGPEFYARDVVLVARELLGCAVEHAGTSGVIVETEAYHESEAACHAHVGRTARTRVLFGPPGRAYVYRSYGIHAMLNAVCEPEGVGAAVLIRALSPLTGVELMRERRGLRDRAPDSELCSGPGKLTQALAIELDLNDTDLRTGAVRILAPAGRSAGAAGTAAAGDGAPAPRGERVLTGTRIGITKAAELPWRFSLAGSEHVSRPWPKDPGPARVEA